MPIEYELKFVIKEFPEIEKLIASQAERAIQIEQKYLAIDKGLSVRIRLSKEKESNSYYMTVKKDVDNQTVEIETEISKDDFKKLWPVGNNKVIKTRYIYQGWDIDFFKFKGSNYLAIAEIELEPNTKPEFIPEVIQNYLIYAVPIEDKRFSSRKLGDVKYALQLLSEIRKKKKC